MTLAAGPELPGGASRARRRIQFGGGAPGDGSARPPLGKLADITESFLASACCGSEPAPADARTDGRQEPGPGRHHAFSTFVSLQILEAVFQSGSKPPPANGSINEGQTSGRVSNLPVQILDSRRSLCTILSSKPPPGNDLSVYVPAGQGFATNVQETVLIINHQKV